jgi:hypothetical protein
MTLIMQIVGNYVTADTVSWEDHVERLRSTSYGRLSAARHLGATMYADGIQQPLLVGAGFSTVRTMSEAVLR